MLVPARKMKAGAQKFVIHRVKKTPGVGPPAGTAEKTRTWSMAIRIMTAPRIRSIETTRGFDATLDEAGTAVRVAVIVSSDFYSGMDCLAFGIDTGGLVNHAPPVTRTR